MTAFADRRDPSAPRRPFRATVELAGTDERDGYQADAIDLSIGGMSVKTLLRPEVGEQLQCRFTLDDGRAVDACGEVVWTHGEGEQSGAFGVKFVALAPGARDAIRASSPPPEPADDAPRRARARDDGKVRLFIQGMDAPLRARVRGRVPGALVLGSDLSFLKLGERVEVDGRDDRKAGAIEAVDVEVDEATGVPRLVLTVAIDGEARAPAPEPEAPSPRAAPVVAPPTSEPALEDAVAVARSAPAPSRSARATAVVRPTETAAAERDDDSESDDDAHDARDARDASGARSDHGDRDDQDDDRDERGAWLATSMDAARGAFARFAAWSGPALRRAASSAGEATTNLADSARARWAAARGTAAAEPASPSPRGGLRRQHAAEAAKRAPTARQRKLALMYVGVAAALAVVVVAVASSGGPAPRPPRPQVAVSASETAPVTALPTPGEGAPEGGAESEAPTEAVGRTVAARGALPPDLAGASASRNAVVETPEVVDREARRPAIRRAPRVAAPAAPRVAAAERPRSHATASAPAARPAPAPVPAVTPVAVFGNPAVRRGTVLRLRMDGAISQIAGVGVRGASIVIRVPGRRSLDVAAPLVAQDPRLVGAGVYNRPTGAELVLRFREPAPPFSARSRNNTLEIVLAPPPAPAGHVSRRHAAR